MPTSSQMPCSRREKVADTCSTCKWWGKRHGDRKSPPYHDHPLSLCVKQGRHASAKMWTTQDDTIFGVHIYTGPNFGCIHHEKKEG
jgi:hypothetical protein